MHLMPYIGKDEHPSNLNLSKTANNNLHFHLVGPVSALLKFWKEKAEDSLQYRQQEIPIPDTPTRFL